MITIHNRLAQSIVSLAILILAVVSFTADSASAAPIPQSSSYTVQAGDTWHSIALSFGIPVSQLWQANGIVNPRKLAEQQRLYIPSSSASLGEQDALVAFNMTPGQPVIWAAVWSGNTLTPLLFLNGFDSPAEAVGQRLYTLDRRASISGFVADAGQPASTSTPDPSPTPSTQPPTPTATHAAPTPIPPDALDRSLMGIQAHLLIEHEQRERMLDMIAYDLGMRWVKQQIPWKDFEYLPGQYSEVMVAALDWLMQNATARNLNVLLSVVKAPDWARSTTEEDGPPDDYSAYYDFIGFLVARYKYQIAAIEVWNEPNLGREWRGASLHGADYVQLLAGAYDRIHHEYPEGNIVVVSAGLAPTGVSDGVAAVDDRTYFRQMYEAGVQNYADAIGIHPYSWGNPPTVTCCGDWGGAPTHNDHPTFFFQNTIQDYRQIQTEFGDSTPFWATEFGWGTMDGLDRPVPPDASFFNYVNQGQQAQYILDAFRQGQEWDFMGPMFLWNLNVSTLPGGDDNQSGYSILRSNGQPRHAFNVINQAPKFDSTTE